MIKKIILAATILLLVAGTGLFFWARAILASDAVRTAVAGQLTKVLGQPVTIGRISATIFPRVTMNLGEVAIGPAGRLTAEMLHVGTDFRALLSRRVEHGIVRATGIHAELPLPALTIGGSETAGGQASTPPVQIVSIDAISLRQIELVSGGRTLRADVELVPQRDGRLTIRGATLGAGETAIDLAGQVTDLTGPTGELTVRAKRLDLIEMLAFITDFARGAGISVSPGASSGARQGTARASAVAMNISLDINADRVTLGNLALDAVNGRARITPDDVALEPIAFRAFDGSYDGMLALAMGAMPAFRVKGQLSQVDMAQFMAFAGTPGTITGRLSGSVNLTGKGTTAANVVGTVRGTARADIVDGVVKGLGLVREVVLATSMRGDSRGASAEASASERFSSLGATLLISGGVARTEDLRFESPDVLLAAAGAVRLDGKAVDLAGKVQLSDALSQQAGRDLVRYTQEGGRVTLPATVSGPAGNLKVRVDVAGVAKRAIVNRANEEVGKAIKKGLGGLFGR